MITRYRSLAEYNRWANRRLFAAAAALPEEEYRRDLGAFFGSVHGTLNHLLVADRIWMGRFTGEGAPPPALDLILHQEREALTDAREVEDARIVRYIASLTSEGLREAIRYRTVVRPVWVSQPLADTLDHFFNHQTHHRGQVHALLTRLGGRDAGPSLDLIVFQREQSAGDQISAK